MTVGDFGDFNPDAELDWKKLDDYRRKEIVKLCANQCALYGDVCDAFYVEKKGDGTNCHLVEETSARIIGHGEDTLKVYYIKHVSFESSFRMAFVIFIFLAICKCFNYQYTSSPYSTM